jgi:hypothetical protein
MHRLNDKEVVGVFVRFGAPLFTYSFALKRNLSTEFNHQVLIE